VKVTAEATTMSSAAARSRADRRDGDGHGGNQVGCLRR
jgi:hypothetical protein